MYLLDTHTLLWFFNDDSNLSENVRQIMESHSKLYVSIVSIWEIAIKKSIGKLELNENIKQLAQLCKEQNIEILPIYPNHLDLLQYLPNLHKDPFDRLLICTALYEGLIFLTRDQKIKQYNIDIKW